MILDLRGRLLAYLFVREHKNRNDEIELVDVMS